MKWNEIELIIVQIWLMLHSAALGTEPTEMKFDDNAVRCVRWLLLLASSGSALSRAVIRWIANDGNAVLADAQAELSLLPDNTARSRLCTPAQCALSDRDYWPQCSSTVQNTADSQSVAGSGRALTGRRTHWALPMGRLQKTANRPHWWRSSSSTNSRWWWWWAWWWCASANSARRKDISLFLLLFPCAEKSIAVRLVWLTFHTLQQSTEQFVR